MVVEQAKGGTPEDHEATKGGPQEGHDAAKGVPPEVRCYACIKVSQGQNAGGHCRAQGRGAGGVSESSDIQAGQGRLAGGQVYGRGGPLEGKTYSKLLI